PSSFSISRGGEQGDGRRGYADHPRRFTSALPEPPRRRPMTDLTVSSSRRAARPGLFGGQVSSKQRVPQRDPSESDAQRANKKPLAFRTVLGDAADLVKARKGRLMLGLGL